MPVLGKAFPNRPSALAHLAQDEADWTPPTYQNVGAPPHVDHASLPPQRLADPLELADGRWFVKANAHASYRNDNAQKRAARRADSIEVTDVKRDTSDPHMHGQSAQSGIVERPGKAKARTA